MSLNRFRAEPGARLCWTCAIGWPQWLVRRHLFRERAAAQIARLSEQYPEAVRDDHR